MSLRPNAPAFRPLSHPPRSHTSFFACLHSCHSPLRGEGCNGRSGKCTPLPTPHALLSSSISTCIQSDSPPRPSLCAFDTPPSPQVDRRSNRAAVAARLLPVGGQQHGEPPVRHLHQTGSFVCYRFVCYHHACMRAYVIRRLRVGAQCLPLHMHTRTHARGTRGSAFMSRRRRMKSCGNTSFVFDSPSRCARVCGVTPLSPHSAAH